MTRDKIHQYWSHWRSKAVGELGEERSQFLLGVVKQFIELDSKILEIGCNFGRNLYYLSQEGYKNLSGIEISKDAIQLMKERFPECMRSWQIFNNPVEDIIRELGDGEFSVVFTMAVLEHIHPDSEWIFSEIIRITSNYLLIIEDEKRGSWKHFPRKYKKIFEDLGMREVWSVNCEGIQGLGSNFFARLFEKVD